MPLREAGLPILFGKGVDSKTDPKAVAVTDLLDLQNGLFSTPMAISKRNGYDALSTKVDSTGLDYPAPDGIAKRGSELLIFANGRSYSYRPSTDLWSDAGEVSSVVAETRPISRTGTAQVMPDTAIRNGIQIVAWEDSRGGVWCDVLEESSGRVLVAQTQLDDLGQSPRCLYTGSSLHVTWLRPDISTIYIATLSTFDPSLTLTTSTLAEDLHPTNAVYDAESCGPGFIQDQEPGVIVWARDIGGFRVAYLDEGGAIGTPSVHLSTNAAYTDSVSGPIAVTVDRYGAGTVAVMWTSGQVKVRFLDASDLRVTTRTASLGSALLTPWKLTCCYGRLLDGAPGLWWAVQVNDAGGRTDQTLVRSGITLEAASTYDADDTELRGYVLLSRAFYDGPELRPTADPDAAVEPTGDVYAMMSYAVRLFPYVACVRLSADAGIAGGETVSVARLLPGESTATQFRLVSGGPTYEEVRHLSSVVDRDRVDTDTLSRRHATALTYRIQLNTANGDQFSEAGIKYATLDFASETSYQTAELGRGLYMASASPQHYDGDVWSEADFSAAPDWGYDDDGTAIDPGVSFVPSPGGSIANGTYLYKCWYEHVDAQGELHRGPVSAGVLVELTGGNGSVAIAIPTYRLTTKRRVRVCVARSIVGAEGDDESIALYRVTGVDASVTTGDNCMVFNDPTAHTVAFTDSLADEDLLLREPLYTNGGVRSNDPSPWAGGVIGGGKSRLFWSDPTDQNLVRFSKTVNDDTGLEAPSSFSLRTDPYGGKIIAIWVMDDVVYVGKETAVYAFAGPGPEDAPDIQPDVNAFTAPALVTTDVGVESASSVCQTPIGTMFKSPKGIVLLGRDRQISRIGDPVDGYRSQRVMQTTLLPDRPHIVVLTDSGRTLMFDYERGQWSTFTNHEGYGAVVVDGDYYYLRTADIRVFKENRDSYSDAGAHIPLVIDTAWIKLAGYLQGFQSILWAYFLGTYRSPHTLRVSFRRDYDSVWLGPVEMDVDTNHDLREYGAGIYGDGLYGVNDQDPATLYQRRVHLNLKSQAIQFRIEDREANDDFGQCFELTELLVVGGVLSTKNPAGAARSG